MPALQPCLHKHGSQTKGSLMNDMDREQSQSVGGGMLAGGMAGTGAGAAGGGVVGWGIGMACGTIMGFIWGLLLGLMIERRR